MSRKKNGEHQPHPGPSKSGHQKKYDAKKQAESEARLLTPEGEEERVQGNKKRFKKNPSLAGLSGNSYIGLGIVALVAGFLLLKKKSAPTLFVDSFEKPTPDINRIVG